MEPCLNFISDPKKMSIAVSNSGSEQKVFNVLKGSTGVSEVVGDNIFVEDSISIQSESSTGNSDIASSCLPSAIAYDINRIFMISPDSNSGSAIIISIDLLTGLYVDSVSLPFCVGSGADPSIYYHNGFVYLISVDSSAPNKGIYIINGLDLSYSFIPVPGVGQLRYGDIDYENNRFYFCSFSDQLLWYIDTTTNTLGSSTSIGMNANYCKIGSTQIAISSTASNRIKLYNRTTLLFSGETIGATNYAEIAYSNNIFAVTGVATDGIYFVNETTFAYTPILIACSEIGFTRVIRNDRYFYIGTTALSANFVEVDMINLSATIITSVFSGSYGYQLNYNSISDKLEMATGSSIVYSVNPSNGSSSSVTIPVTGMENLNVNSLICSQYSGESFIIKKGAGATTDQIYVLNQVSDAVTIIYNGGNTSVEAIDQFLIGNPMKVLHMKIISSSREQLLNLLTKSRNDSAGTINSFQIKSIVNFNVDDEQYVVDFMGEELFDPLFDGQTYLQGLINGNSSMSFEIDYVEYDQSRVVSSTDCAEQPVKKKKVCYFHNRRLL